MTKIDGNSSTSRKDRTTFTRHLGAFSSATLLSRILGYVRDAMVAAFFGGGIQTDAFYAAFKIPNLLRRFLGEGALTAAFVPVFTDTLQKDGKEEARNFLNALFTGLLIVLAVIVVLGIYFAPEVTKLVAWGFTRDPEKFELTVQLTRLIFPFLLLISVAALVSAVLNSCGRFFTPALAPSGLSIGEIAFIALFASRSSSPVEGLAIAAVIGVGIHLVWQLPALYKEGYALKLVKPFAHPRLKTVFALMLPAIVGLCADQVNSFVDQLCASFLKNGSVTALYNSNRVMQLPLALFGVAVASVALPGLSRAAAKNDEKDFKELLGFSLRIANFVLIPSFIGLAVLGLPIITALFERGRFLPEHSQLTFLALVPYAAGLPAYSAAKILASAFYARKNTKTPVRVAFWAMAIHAVLSVALMWKFEVAGLAASTAISAWFQTICLFILLRREIGGMGGRGIAHSFLVGCGIGTVMGVLCYLAAFVFLANSHVIIRVIASISVGTLAYFVIARSLKIQEYDFFINALRRRTP